MRTIRISGFTLSEADRLQTLGYGIDWEKHPEDGTYSAFLSITESLSLDLACIGDVLAGDEEESNEA